METRQDFTLLILTNAGAAVRNLGRPLVLPRIPGVLAVLFGVYLTS